MDDRERRQALLDVADDAGACAFEQLLDVGVGSRSDDAARGIVVGRLVGFAENGRIPLVTYAGQSGTAAIPARTTIDLCGAHIGRDVVLLFEGGDMARPIAIGWIRDHSATGLAALPGSVDVEADGERLVVSARQRLVLRCGKASITLTSDGRVVVRGTQVVSHASGLNRVRGGSVQIN